MLKEAHVIFRIVEQGEADRLADKLDAFDAILLPGVSLDPASAFTRALACTSACVITTGMAMESNPELLRSLFGVQLGTELANSRGHYLLTQPKAIWTRFAETDWVFLDKRYRPMELAEDNEGLLPLISSAPFGPPEFCYGHEVTGQSAVSVREGRLAYVPFMLGSLYYQHGFTEFKHLLLDLLDRLRGTENQPFTTNAPPCVEMFWHRCGEGRMLLQLLNHSGYNGMTVEPPLPIFDIQVEIKGQAAKKAVALEPDGEKPMDLQGEKLPIPVLAQYAAYLLEF